MNASSIQSIHHSPHYTWGNGCDGWWLHQHGKFTVISERMPPHTSEKRHVHQRTDQFFYCLSGQLSIQLHDKEKTLKAHEGIAVQAGVPHKVNNKSSSDLEFLVISSADSHHDKIDMPS
jgi:mannose-6-phosphate isomerase-like protein (cupin superfamily)